MFEKVVAGRRYRVDVKNNNFGNVFLEDIEKYANNDVILISKVNLYGSGGKWEFKRDSGQEDNWWFAKNELLPLREEAFLEIFKEEIYG